MRAFTSSACSYLNMALILSSLLLWNHVAGADTVTENFDTDPGWTASGPGEGSKP